MTTYRSEIVKCIDCENKYILSAGEQEFYTGKSLSLPKRCPDCRRKKKREGNNVFKGKHIS